MARRYINNITITCEVGENVTLPTTVIALEDSFNYSPVPVQSWINGDGEIITVANTGTKGEYIFEGTVVGYAHKIYCSVVVGDLDYNPPSTFPEFIDSFGTPKHDINTSDVPDVDDYQYFKAKKNRTKVEQYQLQQLTELLADKIILARDVNHTRNAVIELEKHAKTLQNKLEDLESRVTTIEDTMTTDGENLGLGEEVFKVKRARKLQFRTIRGEGNAEVRTEGDEIVVAVGGGDVSMDNCGSGDFRADSFEICKEDGYLKFSDYMGLRFVDVDSVNKSILFVLGVGDGESSFKNAGRILKGNRNFVFEMKTVGGYSGIDIHGDSGEVETYKNHANSHINDRLSGSLRDAYSTDVAMRRSTGIEV